MTGNTPEEIMIEEGAPDLAPPPENTQDLGITSTIVSAASEVTAVTAPYPKDVLVTLTEGTPEHETFAQEFHEFLTSVKRDTAEIIAWLKSKL